MKCRRIRFRAGLLLCELALCGVSLVMADEQPAKGWLAAGSNPGDYQMGADRAVAHSGRASGYVKSNLPEPKGFATLMQMFKAGTYAGKRVRMTGYVKAAAIENWAGLWMRVDGPEGKMLAFDNMQSRPIKGTREWTKYDFVLDVPENSLAIAFGILLSGRGQAWVDDLQFQVVGRDVPTTNTEEAGKELSQAPQNLSFED